LDVLEAAARTTSTFDVKACGFRESVFFRASLTSASLELLLLQEMHLQAGEQKAP